MQLTMQKIWLKDTTSYSDWPPLSMVYSNDKFRKWHKWCRHRDWNQPAIDIRCSNANWQHQTVLLWSLPIECPSFLAHEMCAICHHFHWCICYAGAPFLFCVRFLGHLKQQLWLISNRMFAILSIALSIPASVFNSLSVGWRNRIKPVEHNIHLANE